MLPIIYDVDSIASLKTIIESNPGVIVLKFGATWCGPCKTIEPVLQYLTGQMPNNVQYIVIDIDVSFEVYNFMKQKRLVNGVPALFAYYKGNVSYVPDDIVVGANTKEVNSLFEKVYKRACLYNV